MTYPKLLTFVHISDTHLHVDPEYRDDFTPVASRVQVNRLIDAINALPYAVDFVMHTGDIVHNPDSGEHYRVANQVLSRLNYPIYYVPGNHDDVPMMQRDFLNLADEHISAYFDYQFAVNGVQVVMLDSHAPAGEDRHDGYLAPEQLERLEAICAAPDTRPMVVGLHHHALPLEAPWLDTLVLENGLALHEVLLKAKHRLRGVFYGHIHESVVTVRDGISYYSVQSGWFQTSTWYGATEPASDPLTNPGFNVVTLTERDTFVRFVRLPGV